MTAARTPTAFDITNRTQPCRSCTVPVVWAYTAKGRWMPVKPDPNPAGNIVLELQRDDDGGDYLVAHVLRRQQIPGARAAGQQLRTSHFTDCPRADHHRRNGR